MVRYTPTAILMSGDQSPFTAPLRAGLTIIAGGTLRPWRTGGDGVNLGFQPVKLLAEFFSGEQRAVHWFIWIKGHKV